MARVFKRGKKWWLDYHHQGKRYREAVGPSKRDAERALAKRLTEIVEGKFLDIKKRCKLTLEEFSPRFLEWSRTHKRSWQRDERLMKNLCTHFGKINLEKIGIADVERYKHRRLSGKLRFGRMMELKSGEIKDLTVIAGPTTVNHELSCLRRVLNMAVEWGELHENPIAGKLTFLKEPEGRVRYLTPEEAEKLLECCAKHLRPIVHLAMLTGMRQNEIKLLNWDSEVDLARGLIHLPGSRTKNGRPRIVPLSTEARRVLLNARDNRLDGCSLVFHRPDGRPLGNFRKAWQNACEKAGIQDIRFHDLRHAFASALAMRGVPLQAIGELLGHRSEGMTKRYAHLSPEVLKGAVEQADRYLKGNELDGVERLDRAGLEDKHKNGTQGHDGQLIPIERDGVEARQEGVC
jgi:integrase